MGTLLYFALYGMCRMSSSGAAVRVGFRLERCAWSVLHGQCRM